MPRSSRSTRGRSPRSSRASAEVAERLGVPDRAAAVAAVMRARIARVREFVAELEPRRVFVAEWLDPPFAAGHWVPEMVELAGGEEVLGRAGEASFPTTWAAVLERSPELVVVAPCGFDAERTAREARLPPLPCRAVAVDANAYFSRPAPRVADGVAQLAFLLHPQVVSDPGLPWIELQSATSSKPDVVARHQALEQPLPRVAED